MISNYKELSRRWTRFDINGLTCSIDVENKPITDIIIRINGKLTRINRGLIKIKELDEFIDGLNISDKLQNKE